MGTNLGMIPRLPEWGKIKIGYKGEEKTSGQGKKFAQPEKLDSFIITTMERDAADRFLADKELMGKFAPEGSPQIQKGPYKGLPLIKEIKVSLLYDDIDLNFFRRRVCYQGARCWCSGAVDGETAQRRLPNGKFQEVQCPCERLDVSYENKDKCKVMGTLQLLIEGTDRLGGVWKLRTASGNSVEGIWSSLVFYKTLTGGPLAGIPFWLVLIPKTGIIPAGPMAGQSTVVQVVSLHYRAAGRKRLEQGNGNNWLLMSASEEIRELAYDIAKSRIEHKLRMDTVEAEARKMLVAPHAESILDQAETGAEFFPENFLANGRDPEPGTSAASAGPDNDPLGLDGGGEPEKIITIPRDTKPGPQDESKASITLPALMEFAKNPPETRITLPVTLVTNQGVTIGRWLDYALSPEGEMQVTLELVPNLKEVTHGMTPEDFKRFLAEAGINLVISQQVTVEATKKEPARKPQNAGMDLF